MATKPAKQALNLTSAEILNGIRADASAEYRAAVPRAVVGDISSIRSIGQVVTSYRPFKNEFLGALYNRIATVIVSSKVFYNRLDVFKKGLFDLGDTVEEVFVNIARVHEFNQERAETEWMKREIPDVRAAFHAINYSKFYKATISNKELSQAFLSWDGVTDLIARIVDQMYSGANYDEYLATKYLLARAILDGNLYPVAVQPTAADSAKSTVTQIKYISNLIETPSTQYNMAGVLNFSLKENQYIILNSLFDATMDVEVLAAAFNMDKAEFMGRRIVIDSFGRMDTARLGELFKEDPGYVEISQDELNLLDGIPAVVVDKDFFMIFDNLQEFAEDYNGQGLYWQYWLHAWKTLSYSPFANAIVFAPGASTVTAVTVTPATATVAPGSSIKLTATVTGDLFPQKTVTWSVDSDFATVDNEGNVKVASDATAGTSITVTATSNFDTTKSGTATLTVS